MGHFPTRALLGSALLVLFTGTGAAQGTSDAGGELPGLQRLSYGLASGATGEAAQPRMAERRDWPQLHVGDALDGWNFGDARHEVLANGPNKILAVFRESDVRIEIPLHMTFRDTPQLRVKIVVRGEGFLLRASLASGEEIVGSAQVAIEKAIRTKRIVLNFPSLKGAQAADRLILELPAGGLPVGLEALAIEDMPLGDYPPAASFGGMTLVNIGADARRATCISDDGLGVLQTVEVTHSDQELRFSYGLPESLRQPGFEPAIVLAVKAEGAESSTAVFQFQSPADGSACWNTESLKLGKYAGKQVTLRFQLSSGDAKTKKVRPVGSPPRFALLGEAQLVRPMEAPPSVLLVTSSSQRADHVGYSGASDAPKTPFLDSLAREGVAFLNASATTNGTLPSHIAILTGLRAGDSGVVARELPLVAGARALAQVFAERGYVTLAAVSDKSLNAKLSGLGRGFDRFGNVLSAQKRNAQQTIEQLEGWMADFSDQPLFVWLHMSDASGPYNAPGRTVHRYYPESLNPYDPASPVASFARAPEWDPLIADPMYTEALYDAANTSQDQLLQRFVNQGRLKHGWIAYTADHGETLRKGGTARFSHTGLSWSNLAVPLLFKGPGLAAVPAREDPVQQSAAGRTLLRLAGLANAQYPGSDVLSGETNANAPRFAVEEGGTSACVIEGTWLLRVQLHPLGSSTLPDAALLHRAELFDLTREDHAQLLPGDKEVDRKIRLRAQLTEWLQQTREGAWSWMDPACGCDNCLDER